MTRKIVLAASTMLCALALVGSVVGSAEAESHGSHPGKVCQGRLGAVLANEGLVLAVKHIDCWGAAKLVPGLLEAAPANRGHATSGIEHYGVNGWRCEFFRAPRHEMAWGYATCRSRGRMIGVAAWGERF
jgi:hypothetical protein